MALASQPQRFRNGAVSLNFRMVRFLGLLEEGEVHLAMAFAKAMPM